MFYKKRKLDRKILVATSILTILFLIMLVNVFGLTINVQAQSGFEEEIYNFGGENTKTNNPAQGVINLEEYSIENFTNIKYIDNKNYFIHNPKHKKNDSSDNGAGTCTTVAVQMMIGYHNYFTDRRLIPTIKNGTRYLDETFGDVQAHPFIDRDIVGGLGCLKTGTDDNVYYGIYNQSIFSGVYGLGQMIPLVRECAKDFINDVSPIKDNVNISGFQINHIQVRNDIDSGNPIVLGFNPIGSGADSFHVVIAYGYANLNGVDGYIVHYGHNGNKTHMWVPSSWFGYQIRMSVEHTHEFIETGNIFTQNDIVYCVKQCTECGYSYPVKVYDTTNIGNNEIRIDEFTLHSYSNEITVPETLEGRVVKQIGYYAFLESSLPKVTLPNTVTQIGDNAFPTNTIVDWLEKYSFQNNKFLKLLDNETSSFIVPGVIAGRQITRIGSFAFYDSNNIATVTVPHTVTHMESNAFNTTRNISILLPGRTSVPTTFSVHWNSSQNPVYLDGQLCTHTNTVLTDLGTKHGQLCTKCRTVVSSSHHNYYMHEWLNQYRHRSTCSVCRARKTRGHIVTLSDPNLCIDCGGYADMGFVIPKNNNIENVSYYFGNGSYILNNGIVVLSDEDLIAYYNGMLEIPYDSLDRYDCCNDTDFIREIPLYFEDRRDYLF